MNKTRWITLFAVPMMLLLSSVSARADILIDPVGDFLPTYVGPHGGDLDVVTTNVFSEGSDLLFSAVMNAPIGTTAQGFYVWGVDRGGSVANFASLGLPNITFDTVLVIQPNGTGIVMVLGGPTTPLNPANIVISGNTFLARVPLALLPPNGFTVEQYGQNLWPRWGGVPFGDPQISDFAPDTRNAGVQVPEPASLLLLSAGLVGLGSRLRRRKMT
jgi:hypothetical protein